MSPSVGFVGLGSIGKPMALRLAAVVPLVVYDVESGPCDELAAAGAEVGRSVAELAACIDVLCVMVRDDDQVRGVVTQALATARPGTVVAIHSTIAPETAAQLAEIAAARAVDVLDAAVSGGPVGAAEGRLAILVGGSETGFARCAEPFAAMGSLVIHAGPVGAGTRMKLARNLLHFVSFTAVGEAQRLAEAAGLDLVELGRVVRHTDAVTGGPGAVMHRDTTAPIDPEDFWFPVFDHVRVLGEKDLGFALTLADRLGVDVPLARQALTGLAPALGLPASVPREDTHG